MFYPLLSTGLIIAAIFINYLGKTDTDHYQRRVYFFALIFIFSAIAVNFAGTMLEGREGRAIHILLIVVFNIFILLQQCSYYATVIFLDYMVNKDNTRTKIFFYIVTGVMAANIIILAINYFNGFYFYISDTNRFMHGSRFLVRFYMSYSAVLMAIIDIFVSKRQLRAAQVRIISFFALLCGAGAVLDIVLPGSYLIWAFLTTSMLIAYFFIIYSDSTLDPVTGIGNRSGFVEFINQISRSNTRQTYTIALFDIDDLKNINNKYGRPSGDSALADVAALLKKCTRQYDFISRHGADEFLVAIKSKFDIEKLIGRILQSLNELNQEPERRYSLSVSYGYNTYNTREDQSIDEFLRHLKEQVSRNGKHSDANTKSRSAGI